MKRFDDIRDWLLNRTNIYWLSIRSTVTNRQFFYQVKFVQRKYFLNFHVLQFIQYVSIVTFVASLVSCALVYARVVEMSKNDMFFHSNEHVYIYFYGSLQLYSLVFLFVVSIYNF